MVRIHLCTDTSHVYTHMTYANTRTCIDLYMSMKGCFSYNS